MQETMKASNMGVFPYLILLFSRNHGMATGIAQVFRALPGAREYLGCGAAPLVAIVSRGDAGMPNDAKLGLVVGVGVVIAVAFVFFRKEAGASVQLPNGATAAAVNSPKDAAADAGRGSGQPVKAESSGQTLGTISQTIPTVRRHTVQAGDSLIGLAEKYYGDRDKSELIFQANREVLQNADELAPGTRLVIPHAAVRGQELPFPFEETGK
jgi:hypothetical protein